MITPSSQGLAAFSIAARVANVRKENRLPVLAERFEVLPIDGRRPGRDLSNCRRIKERRWPTLLSLPDLLDPKPDFPAAFSHLGKIYDVANLAERINKLLETFDRAKLRQTMAGLLSF
jgi:hypothetical protein